MKKLYLITSLVTLIFPLGYLFDKIQASIAFPVSFTMIGFLFLINGLFIIDKTKKNMKIFISILGVGFILFSSFCVIPYYYL